VWPDSERKLWLQLLEASFKLIYKDKVDEKPRVERVRLSEEARSRSNREDDEAAN
jgi:hypothetical protein